MNYNFCALAKIRRAAAILLVFALSLGIVFGTAGCSEPQKERFQKTYLDAFDTAISVVGYSDSEEAFTEMAETYVHNELMRYHRLYDIYTEYAGINNIKTINENAGIEPVAVDGDIIAMLEFARDMYYVTDGKVNIAMGSVLELWHDARNHGINYPDKAKLPDMAKLEAASAHCNIEDMIIDKEAGTVFLADSDMRLDVGAVAKGYATERIAQDLEAGGYTNIILNIGGNVRTIGTKADGMPWVVGIQNPDLMSSIAHIETIETDALSLATSGVYQRFYVVDGKNYHHIIDGDTLMPEDRYLSVSVLTEDSGLADALSTALFNMDYEEGKSFVEGLASSVSAERGLAAGLSENAPSRAGVTEAETDDEETEETGADSVIEVMWVMPDGEKRYTDGFEAYIVSETK